MSSGIFVEFAHKDPTPEQVEKQVFVMRVEWLGYEFLVERSMDEFITFKQGLVAKYSKVEFPALPSKRGALSSYSSTKLQEYASQRKVLKAFVKQFVQPSSLDSMVHKIQTSDDCFWQFFCPPKLIKAFEDVPTAAVLVLQASPQKTLTVQRSAQRKQTVEVNAGNIVVWEFSVVGPDIGFQVMFGDKEVTPYMYAKSVEAPVRGRFNAPTKGSVTLVWDNTYSRLRTKTVALRLQVIESEMMVAAEMGEEEGRKAVMERLNFTDTRRALKAERASRRMSLMADAQDERKRSESVATPAAIPEAQDADDATPAVAALTASQLEELETLRAQVAQQQEELEAVRQRATDSEAELAAASSEASSKASTITELEQAVKELQVNLARTQTERDEATTAADTSAEQAALLAVQLAAIPELEAEVDRLKQLQLDDAAGDAEAAEAATAAAAVRGAEEGALQSRITELEAQAKQAEEANAELTSQVSSLQAELAGSSEASTTLREQLEAVNEQLAKVSAEHATLQAAAAAAALAEQAEGAAAKSGKPETQASKQLAAAVKRAKDAEHVAEERLAEVAAAKAELASLKKTLAKVEAALQREKQATAEAKAALQSERQALTKARTLLQSKQQSAESVEETLSQARVRYTRLGAAMQAAFAVVCSRALAGSWAACKRKLESQLTAQKRNVKALAQQVRRLEAAKPQTAAASDAGDGKDDTSGDTATSETPTSPWEHKAQAALEDNKKLRKALLSARANKAVKRLETEKMELQLDAQSLRAGLHEAKVALAAQKQSIAKLKAEKKALVRELRKRSRAPDTVKASPPHDAGVAMQRGPGAPSPTHRGSSAAALQMGAGNAPPIPRPMAGGPTSPAALQQPMAAGYQPQSTPPMRQPLAAGPMSGGDGAQPAAANAPAFPSLDLWEEPSRQQAAPAPAPAPRGDLNIMGPATIRDPSELTGPYAATGPRASGTAPGRPSPSSGRSSGRMAPHLHPGAGSGRQAASPGQYPLGSPMARSGAMASPFASHAFFCVVKEGSKPMLHTVRTAVAPRYKNDPSGRLMYASRPIERTPQEVDPRRTSATQPKARKSVFGGWASKMLDNVKDFTAELTATEVYTSCDSCRAPAIEGTRWHCAACASFDICDRCYQLGAHGFE